MLDVSSIAFGWIWNEREFAKPDTKHILAFIHWEVAGKRGQTE